MRWEDERYVRVYTRDTGDWLDLSFEAQALFLMLLRKVDRIGELRLGKRGKPAVAGLVGHADKPELRQALEDLLKDGCVGLRDGGQVLVVPNFLKAQETPKSSTERKREQRNRDAALAGEMSRMSRDDVTERDTRDGGVTSHEMSLHAVPNQPCRTEPTGGVTPRVDPVAAPGALYSPAVSEGAKPDLRVKDVGPPEGTPERRAPPDEELDEAMKRVWKEVRSSDFTWQMSRDGEGLRRVLDHAKDSHAEVLRVWRKALAQSFPRCRNVKDLAENWSDYSGTDPPAKTSARGRASEAEKDWSTPPKLRPDGTLDF